MDIDLTSKVGLAEFLEGHYVLRYFVKELHSGLHLSESVMDNCRVKINKITIIYYYSSPVVFLQIGSTRYWLNSAK